MLGSFDLRLLKTAHITDFFKDDLVDLRDVKIEKSKPVSEKINDFFEQIKNPYLYKVGEVRVKVSFSGKGSFSDALGKVILNGENYQAN